MVALLHKEKLKGFSALVLFDVPIQPPGGRPEDLVEMGEAMSASARRRRDCFRTREEYARMLRRIPAFKRLLTGESDLLSQTTLRPASDGQGYTLCCRKGYEAQVYEYLFGLALRIDPQKTSCPVKIVGSDPTEPYSFMPMPTIDLSTLIDVNYDFIPEATDFLQLEQSPKCLDITLGFLESQSLI